MTCFGENSDHRLDKDSCDCLRYYLPLRDVCWQDGGGLHSVPRQSTHTSGIGEPFHLPHGVYVCVAYSCWWSNACRWDIGGWGQENANGGAPEGGSASWSSADIWGRCGCERCALIPLQGTLMEKNIMKLIWNMKSVIHIFSIDTDINNVFTPFSCFNLRILVYCKLAYGDTIPFLSYCDLTKCLLWNDLLHCQMLPFVLLSCIIL